MEGEQVIISRGCKCWMCGNIGSIVVEESYDKQNTEYKIQHVEGVKECPCLVGIINKNQNDEGKRILYNGIFEDKRLFDVVTTINKDGKIVSIEEKVYGEKAPGPEPNSSLESFQKQKTWCAVMEVEFDVLSREIDIALREERNEDLFSFVDMTLMIRRARRIKVVLENMRQNQDNVIESILALDKKQNETKR